MNLTKFNLLLLSLLLIVLYFYIPFYNNWLQKKALSENNNMFNQMQNLDVSYRNQYRFGNTYMFDKDIERTLSTHKDVTLLLPNNNYMKSINVTNLDLQEPSVFYYFTGIKSVWANSPNVEQANWAVVATPKGVRIVEIKTKPQLDSIISVYKKFTN